MSSAVGQPVPSTPHAVSVSLPSWKSVVGYEEGEEWVISRMKTGYPRFFIHLTIQELEKEILQLYGREGEATMLFPSTATALRCQKFCYDKLDDLDRNLVRVIRLEPITNEDRYTEQTAFSGISCVFFPKVYFSTAKQVWQHTGDGISSRLGEFCLKALREGLLQPVIYSPKLKAEDVYTKGPRRYQRGASLSNIVSHTNGTTNGDSFVPEAKDFSQFVEERFGRNLNAKLTSKAKLAIQRRIAGSLTDSSELDQALEVPPNNAERREQGLSEEDVYLFPTGMSAIFNTFRILQADAIAHGHTLLQNICFGFTYIDTLKVLQKWGAGCIFYGNGNSDDVDDLQRRLESGERFLALITEFPSNPLLNSGDLTRLRKLADQYNFIIVVDETVGNFININVLRHADIVVSSLTKIFSGDSNVMGGSAVINPQGKHYKQLKGAFAAEYEDNYWAEDAVFMERNSRDFISRIHRINVNAEAIVATLQACPFTKQVYYPTLSPSRPNYEACRTPNGGYGGLLSVTFQRHEQAIAFFDSLHVDKGPSLGTNFTLACPYTVLAHYAEMDWTAQWGVDPDLVRISVGLEEPQVLAGLFRTALDAAAKV